MHPPRSRLLGPRLHRVGATHPAEEGIWPPRTLLKSQSPERSPSGVQVHPMLAKFSFLFTGASGMAARSLGGIPAAAGTHGADRVRW